MLVTPSDTNGDFFTRAKYVRGSNRQRELSSAERNSVSSTLVSNRGAPTVELL